MIYTPSPLAVSIFLSFVALVLGISFYFARRTSDSKSYFAAGGAIHWGVNGIAFAGDYLSAASFLGICGMIALSGYDGFLYSIGYLAGWIVALFVVAEPFKRLGKYTFADALDAKFNSNGIKLVAGISTLVVSIFYLIPQMVGAGALVTPLLGLPHWIGVIIVGTIVIIIVSTAGMKSTTYVQFLKGALLIIFSTVLVVLVLKKGFHEDPSDDYHDFIVMEYNNVSEMGYSITGEIENHGHNFVRMEKEGLQTWWEVIDGGKVIETLSIVYQKDGPELYNGAPKEEQLFYSVGHMNEIIVDGKKVTDVENLTPFSFLAIIQDSEVVRFKSTSINYEGDKVDLWYQEITSGTSIMRPGLKFHIDEGSSITDKLNFISLMLALFLGTASLPHVLIRYYTVATPKDARKSTIVAIAAIGFFYVLTLYMGLGAMINGVIDPQSGNMSAPLLAKSFGTVLFAIISAIAFATVLGTVSGLIVASAGAVAHDLMADVLKIDFTDKGKVRAGKIAAISVGIIAIFLGILFKGMNVAFLVGWAFAVAASANLPAIVMMLFWKKTTSQGIITGVIVGIVSALTIIMLSPSMMVRYGLEASSAPWTLENPAIIAVPLSFIGLIVVSLMTQKKK